MRRQHEQNEVYVRNRKNESKRGVAELSGEMPRSQVVVLGTIKETVLQSPGGRIKAIEQQ
jgi:hypothetical protein